MPETASALALDGQPAGPPNGDRRPPAGSPRRWLRAPSLELVGVGMAIIVFLCAATSFALQVPPFHGTDERAHLGYAHAVAEGRLPEIEDRPDIPADATRWRDELLHDSKNDSYRTIWVANHPPLHYLLVAPLVWVSNATGRADGGLLLLRFANLAFASVGIVFTYLLGVELTGGSRRLGLAAASIVALLPRGHYEFSQALNDGLAFAAATAVVWAAARVLRRGHSPAGLALVGATVAVAAGTRAATMLLAVAVVGLLTVARLFTTRGPLRAKAAAAIVTAIVGLGPAALLFGWFYLRNIILYGDIGASSHLMERFDRERRGFVEILTDGEMWVRIYQALPTRSILSIRATASGPIVANIAAVVAVAGLVVVAFRRRARHRGTGPAARDVSLPVAAACIVAALVVAATITQHVAAGGLASSRYAFPALGALSCLFVVGIDTIVARLLPLLAVVTLTAWTAHFLPTRVASEIDRRSELDPSDLVSGVGPILLAVSLLSTVALLAILTLISVWRSGERATDVANGRTPQDAASRELGSPLASTAVGDHQDLPIKRPRAGAH